MKKEKIITEKEVITESFLLEKLKERKIYNVIGIDPINLGLFTFLLKVDCPVLSRDGWRVCFGNKDIFVLDPNPKLTKKGFEKKAILVLKELLKIINDDSFENIGLKFENSL